MHSTTALSVVTLACLGCHHKIPGWLGDLNNIHLFFKVLQAGSLRSRLPAGLVSGETSLLGLQTVPFLSLLTFPAF